MEELILKINSLDKPAKQMLQKFLDVLLQTRQLFNYEEYRKRLLELPPWTDEEIAEFDANIAAFKNWKIEEW